MGAHQPPTDPGAAPPAPAVAPASGHPHPANTYDSFSLGDVEDALLMGRTCRESQSLRDRAPPSSQLTAEPDPNDPPLPSYSALMASESSASEVASVSHSPQPLQSSQVTPAHPSNHPQQPLHRVGRGQHSRTCSLDQPPFAPVYYGHPGSLQNQHHQYPQQQSYTHQQQHSYYSQGQNGDAHAASESSNNAMSSPPNPNRLSGGSLHTPFGVGDSRRPISDPNELDMGSLRLTAATPSPPNPVQRQHTIPSKYPSQYPQRPGGGRGAIGPNQRQRAVTGGYPSSSDDSAASVYSLDSGLGAYGGYNYGMSGQQQTAHPLPPSAWNPSVNSYPQQQQPLPAGDFSNPYYSAANDFLGLPPGAQSYATGGLIGGPSAATLPHSAPSRQASMTTLARTNTSISALSSNSALSTSSASLARKPTESVGASSTRRRGTAAAIDVNKPPYTKEFVDDYRNRMKHDPDPEAQFAFSKYLIEAAKKLGDEISQTDPRLGRRYRDSLLQESLRNIKKLAEGKEPYADAQFFLANLYGTGQLGLQVDHDKAYYLYMMASKLNHAAATYRAAVCNELGAGTKKDYHRATLFYRKAAALGDTAAMYKLGMILLGGLLSQPSNPREAIVWLRRAAAQADEDNPHALHELALLHERPTANAINVITPDPNIARDYFTQAAQLGYAPAQFKLGSCHEFGTLGCPIDPRRSIAWYTRAAEKGDAEAELALSGWYLTGSEGVLKQSDTEAYLWGRKAANKGLAKAEYAVGYYTEIGIGVKQDLETAKKWYMRAASQGNKRAMQRLAELNSNRNVKGKAARPTRKEAETECVVM